MKLLVTGAILLSAIGFLIWRFQDGSPPHFRVHELLADGYRKECRVDDGIVQSIEHRGAPLVFTVASPDHPDLLLRVRFPRNRPDNLKPGGPVACIGTYRDGEFHAVEIRTMCPSKYENDSLAGARRA